MAKITLKVSNLGAFGFPQKKLQQVLSEFNKRDLKAVGNDVIKEMKDLISKGVSPIRQVGRFEAYKNPEKYPKKVIGRFPSKKQKPVNLSLSGNFLKSLNVLSSNNGKLTIGFNSKLSEEKEQGHRDGANGQRKRPIIPKSGEEFAVSIQKIIIDEMVKRLNALFK